MKRNVHIGISGWSYYDWKEVFYPPGLSTKDWLSFYAESFSCTEINSSFYRLPRKQTVENWVDKVPQRFFFCPKLNRYITHLKKLRDAEEPMERFFGVFAPMLKKMGPILIQLPPSLSFHEDIAVAFFELLKNKYSVADFVLEPRHKSWLEEESINLLKKYKIGFVISQSGVGFPYAEYVTSKNIYVRFHGPGKLYASSYSEEELAYFASLFKKWLKEKHSLWIFFNNCYNGVAIENARVLEKMLD